MRPSALVLILALGACGDDGSSGDGDDSGTETGSTSIGDDDGSSTGGDDDGTDAGTGGDTGTATEDSGDDTGGDICDGSTTISADWGISGAPFGVDAMWDCTVGELGGSMPTVVPLDCTSDGNPVDPAPSLQLNTNPEIVELIVGNGDAVTIEHLWHPDDAMLGKWFAVRNEGGNLVIGGSDAEILAPPGSTSFYGPVEASIVDGVCPQMPSACGDLQRVAVEATYDGSTEMIVDHNVGYVGQLTSYQIIVDDAYQTANFECDGGTANWYSTLFIALVEG